MKKLKIILAFIVACACANAQSLKQSKISYGALRSKQTNDCINRNAVKTLHTKQMLGGNDQMQNMQVVKAYPNPFSENINLLMSNKQKGFIKLEAYNAMGALIFKSELYAVVEGISNVAYDFKNFSSGLYLFKVMTFDSYQSPVNQYSFKSLKSN